MTFGLGISPSTCTLVVAPQRGAVLLSGTLQITYGPTRLTFPSCRVDTISPSIDPEGHQTWTLRIMDRRWLWKETGRISGFYNVRRSAGKKLARPKRPQELAELCLKAIGESKFDVTGLPNDVFPEIDWDNENPAQALANLAQKLNCAVALDPLSNRVRVVRLGQGQPLRQTAQTLEGEVTVDPGDPPGEISILGARIKWQQDFELEPVGLDVGGKIVPIEKLTYTPSGHGTTKTWQFSDLDEFAEVDERYRNLARASVFRWYRIKVPFTLPGRKDPIKVLDRILPLLGHQVEQMETTEGREQPRPPWVFGRFWSGDGPGRDASDKVERDLDNLPKGLYTRGFAVDVSTGIVKFSEPVVRLKIDSTLAAGRRVFPADIRLRVAVNLREEETFGWIRQAWSKKPPGKRKFPTRKLYKTHEDLAYEVHRDGKTGKVVSNAEDLKGQVAAYRKAEEAKFADEQAGSMTYGGILRIGVDGAIRQVTWIVGRDGKAYTRVSRNQEELVSTVSYEERRFYERVDQALKDREKSPRARAEDARRGTG